MATKLTHLTDEDETAASLLLLGVVESIVALSALVDDPAYVIGAKAAMTAVDEHLLAPFLDLGMARLPS